MGNSKKVQIARKHRQKRRAAKAKVREFLRTKGAAAESLPRLARRLLQRRLRVRAS